jgi:ATP-binding cassette subfamily B (MDR/TAP) protein 1
MSAPAGAARPGTGERPMSIRGMFRFADRVDVLLMALGTLGAIGDGCSTNLLLIFASDVMNALGYGGAQQAGGGGGAKSAQFMHEVEKIRRAPCITCLYRRQVSSAPNRAQHRSSVCIFQ